jgi:2-C-methyl-D-erythritol 2,4-cyclodiphosphate synthase
MEFLKAAGERMRAAGFELVNVDATVILERPKVSPHKMAMRERMARALAVEVSQVTVKGKTHERVDAVGEGRAVEVHAVALVRSR